MDLEFRYFNYGLGTVTKGTITKALGWNDCLSVCVLVCVDFSAYPLFGHSLKGYSFLSVHGAEHSQAKQPLALYEQRAP